MTRGESDHGGFTTAAMATAATASHSPLSRCAFLNHHEEAERREARMDLTVHLATQNRRSQVITLSRTNGIILSFFASFLLSVFTTTPCASRGPPSGPHCFSRIVQVGRAATVFVITVVLLPRTNLSASVR